MGRSRNRARPSTPGESNCGVQALPIDRGRRGRRQIPDNNCNFEITEPIIEKYRGGIFSSCEDPSIRVDGLQNWINGLTAFLEYESMIEAK